MSREIRVGLMFALSLTILGVSLSFLGSFQETMTFEVKFKKINGLALDSPVHFNGVPIGRVTDIAFGESDDGDFSAPPILVEITVHKSIKNHIRGSTVAAIKSIGILGDKYILLITQDYRAPLLDEDDYILPADNTLDMDRLLAQGSDVVSDATQITENLRKLLDQLANKEGLIQKLIGDEDLANQLKDSLLLTLAQIKRDDNMLALLLGDAEFAAGFRGNVNSTLNNLNQLVNEYKEGDGLAHALIHDEQWRQKVTGQLTQLLAASNQFVDRLAQARGLLYRLTEDEAYGERVAQNLEKASYHLASILEKIDQGEGSASLLLNDPSVYQGIYEVVYGVEHSGITKWLIQRKRKKGERAMNKAKRKGDKE